MKLLAMIVPGLMTVTAVPETFQSFSANLESTTKTGGGGMDINIVVTGKLTVSSTLKRVRNDFEKIKMTISMGSGGTGGLPGAGGDIGGGDTGGGDTGGGDTGGGDIGGGDIGGGDTGGGDTGGGDIGGGDIGGGFGGFDGGRRLQDMDIELAANGVELLRYDWGKNFTWMTVGGKTECTCEELEGVMPQYFIDSTASSGGTESIQSNGQSVSTEKWTSSISLSMGDTSATSSITYNVELPKSLRQVKMTNKIQAGEMSITDETTLKFWNVKEVKDNEIAWAQPDPSCKCPEDKPPVIQTAKSYPAPAATCTAVAGCQCPKTAAAADIEFCKDEVNWQYAETIFPKTTDDFVKTAYNDWKSVSGADDDCLADYKTFLCKFYFQICSEGGKLLAPPAFGECTSSSGGKVSVSTAETSGYNEAANLANGKSADGSSTLNFSASSVPAISLAVGLSLAAAALV